MYRNCNEIKRKLLNLSRINAYSPCFNDDTSMQGFLLKLLFGYKIITESNPLIAKLSINQFEKVFVITKMDDNF